MDKYAMENSWPSEIDEHASYYNHGQRSRQDSTSSGYLEPQIAKKYQNMTELAANIHDGYLTPVFKLTDELKYPTEVIGEMNEHMYEKLYHGRSETKKLDLSGKSLTLLPKEGIKPGIEVLILDNNAFQQLPVELFQSEDLIYLSAASQIQPKRASVSHWPALGTIPEDIGKLKKLAFLILYNNALQVLPNSFGNLHNLVYLDLKLNWLSEFPICICKIKSLKELHLSGNHIKEIPQDINQLENLQVFRIGNNGLQNIPEAICTMVSLTCLSLRNNKLEDLPSDMYKLKGLLPPQEGGETKLLLHGNPLKYPPQEIVNETTQAVFDYLKKTPKPTAHRPQKILVKEKKSVMIKTDEVIASERRLEIVVKDQGLLFRKSTPKDGNCFFHAVSDQLQRPNMNLGNFSHTELRMLLVKHLKDGQDESLSKWIEEVTHRPVREYTKNISMDKSWADDIAIHVMAKVLQRDIWIIPSSPDQISTNKDTFNGHVFKGGTGKRLVIGHLHEYHYQSLGTKEDKVDGMLINSQEGYLDLSGKKIEKLQLDPEIKDTIETLLLNDNCILDGKWVTLLRKCPRLKKLSMRNQDEKVLGNACKYNTLGTIPQDIYVLHNLTHLCLARNRITSIPVQLTYLEKLKILDLIHNNISVIPEEIQGLQELEYLGLSNNQIKEIPESIGNLVDLQVLRLSNNNILELPETVCNLRKLFVLSLSNNKLGYLPPDLHQLELLKSKRVYKCSILERTSFKAGLLVEGNKDIKFPNPDICAEGINSIFDFLIDMEKRPNARKEVLQGVKDIVQEQKNSQFLRGKFEVIYKHLTTEFISRLANNVGKEWKNIGRYLEMTTTHIDHCELNNQGNVKEAIIEMLEKWRDSNIGTESEDTLLLKLIEALGEVGRKDLKERLEKQYKRISKQEQRSEQLQ